MGRVVDMQEQRKSENNEATFDLLTCNVLTMLDIEAVRWTLLTCRAIESINGYRR